MKDLLVRSVDHVNGLSRDPPTDFIIHLSQYGLNQVNGVALRSATIPNLFYNVYQSARRLWYADGTSIEIPEGYFNESTICDALASVGLSGCTIKDGLFDFTALPKTVANLDQVDGFVTGPHDSLNRLLGAPHTASSVQDLVDLSGVQEAYVSVSNLAAAQTMTSSANKTMDLLCVVPLNTTQYGFTARYEAWNPNTEIKYAAPRSVQSMHIRITDWLGQDLSLPANQRTSFSFRFY